MNIIEAIQYLIDNPKAIIANQDNERLYIGEVYQTIELTDSEGWDSHPRLTDIYKVSTSSEGLFDAEENNRQHKNRVKKIESIKNEFPEKTVDSIMCKGEDSFVVFDDGSEVLINDESEEN